MLKIHDLAFHYEDSVIGERGKATITLPDKYVRSLLAARGSLAAGALLTEFAVPRETLDVDPRDARFVRARLTTTGVSWSGRAPPSGGGLSERVTTREVSWSELEAANPASAVVSCLRSLDLADAFEDLLEDVRVDTLIEAYDEAVYADQLVGLIAAIDPEMALAAALAAGERIIDASVLIELTSDQPARLCNAVCAARAADGDPATVAYALVRQLLDVMIDEGTALLDEHDALCRLLRAHAPRDAVLARVQARFGTP